MHTTEVGHVIFLHNGDFSGDVEIVVDPDAVKMDAHPATATVTVPFAALKALVAKAVRNHRISTLENASSDEILFDGAGR